MLWQLQWLGCSCVLLPGVLTLAVYAVIAVTYLRVILRGGAGKNGSTVAVWLCIHPIQAFIACHASLLRFPFATNTNSIIYSFRLTTISFLVWFVQGTSVLGPAIPLALVVVPAYIIARKSEEQVFEQNPALYILAFGLVVAKVTNRLVVSLISTRSGA